jgi:calcineurin-like phosphoesterase family protein
MYFFTADEHYGHSNIIKYCNRPFKDVNHMNETLIRNHNEVVGEDDIVVHAGDFALDRDAEQYIRRLNGQHIFLEGSHDRWLQNGKQMWEKKIEGQLVVACHYAMRRWPKSHYGSWNVYGHSHGKLEPIGKQHDVGVDNNHFYPVSFYQLKSIMDKREQGEQIYERREGLS